MGILACTLGILGGLSTVMGIVTALAVFEVLALTWQFWFGLAIVLLLACVAAAVSRTSYES